mmetsp:Transcript_34509/g.97784  ORF Transcript_34509/g.97784 Transcript_34509/m.97784 type:complete len:274 (-) Transcript_34509:292-1113(-)
MSSALPRLQISSSKFASCCRWPSMRLTSRNSQLSSHAPAAMPARLFSPRRSSGMIRWVTSSSQAWESDFLDLAAPSWWIASVYLRFASVWKPLSAKQAGRSMEAWTAAAEVETPGAAGVFFAFLGGSLPSSAALDWRPPDLFAPAVTCFPPPWTLLLACRTSSSTTSSSSSAPPSAPPLSASESLATAALPLPLLVLPPPPDVLGSSMSNISHSSSSSVGSSSSPTRLPASSLPPPSAGCCCSASAGRESLPPASPPLPLPSMGSAAPLPSWL